VFLSSVNLSYIWVPYGGGFLSLQYALWRRTSIYRLLETFARLTLGGTLKG
jgi:hypothetical protein